MSEVVEVKTIGEVERIVHASGLWDGATPVEFSNDGEAWAEHWQPSEEFRVPTFARVETYRKEVRFPARVTARWDEQVPADEAWLALWFAHPMQHFGRTVRMLAFRQMFRDLLGDIRLEDEPAAQEAPAAKRDWAAEFAAATSMDELMPIVREARKLRIFTPDAEGTALDRAWHKRKRELTAGEKKTVKKREREVTHSFADPAGKAEIVIASGEAMKDAGALNEAMQRLADRANEDERARHARPAKGGRK
ncbi:hypothetical protein [Gulosibacter sediminis]|uniref:hypothetical protein n=1 Tax=Gulosibacter sediminis TaxID=1729695 RepID=UPI0024A8727B|nr:hypothetical protein [Gulosibacter sediminis]